jgi:hypothetical protein
MISWLSSPAFGSIVPRGPFVPVSVKAFMEKLHQEHASSIKIDHFGSLQNVDTKAKPVQNTSQVSESVPFH